MKESRMCFWQVDSSEFGCSRRCTVSATGYAYNLSLANMVSKDAGCKVGVATRAIRYTADCLAEVVEVVDDVAKVCEVGVGIKW